MFAWSVQIISHLDSHLKVSSRCLVCYFPAAMLAYHGDTNIWQLHTGLSKFVQNISTNTWSLEKCTVLKLGKVSYFFISYTLLTISWLYTLNGFWIIFYCVTVQPKNTTISFHCRIIHEFCSGLQNFQDCTASILRGVDTKKKNSWALL